MVFRAFSFIILALCLPFSAQAQASHAQSRDNCQRFAPLISQTAGGLAEIWGILSEIDFLYAGARVGGDAGRELAALRTEIELMTPDMHELFRSMQNVAVALEECS